MPMPIITNDDGDSTLEFYSIGIVAVNKPRNSDFIEVTPIETVLTADTLLKNFVTDYHVGMPDHQGVIRNDLLAGGAVLNARWIPLSNSNRMTAPDVIRGETVMIFRLEETEDYYWTTLFREPGIRRLETVNHMYGNIPSGLVPFDKTTSYWAEVSTHDKYVHVHTSKNDGEPFEYDIKLDTAIGKLTITDHVGNHIVLDSANDLIQLVTIAGCQFELWGDRINARSREYNIKCDVFNMDARDVNIYSRSIDLHAEVYLDELTVRRATVFEGGIIGYGGTAPEVIERYYESKAHTDHEPHLDHQGKQPERESIDWEMFELYTGSN